MTEVAGGDDRFQQNWSPWLLRFELDYDKMLEMGIEPKMVTAELYKKFRDDVFCMVRLVVCSSCSVVFARPASSIVSIHTHSIFHHLNVVLSPVFDWLL